MTQISKNSSTERNPPHFSENVRMGFRIYNGLISNLLGARVPFFVGHKLTYNCNLRCKMCPFWRRQQENSSLEQEKAVLKQVYASGACGVALEGGEPLLRRDLEGIFGFFQVFTLAYQPNN